MSDIKKTLGIEDNNEQVVEQREIDTKQEVSNNEVVEQDVQGNIVNQSFIENEAITNAEEIFKPKVQEQTLVEPSFNIVEEEDIKLKQSEIDVANFEMNRTESNFHDYMIAQNPFGLSYYHPEVRLTSKEYYGGVDVNDSQFKAIYDKADLGTKKEMLNALSTEHAVKIAVGRGLIDEANKKIANDSILTQLGMGMGVGLISPTTALPVGTLLNLGKVATTSNTIYRTLKSGAIIGGSSAIAAGIDEQLLAEQGSQSDVMSAMGWAFAFGAPLGLLSGAISGPAKNAAASAMVKERDTYTSDFDTDPLIKTELDEEGNIKIVNDKEKEFLAEDEDGVLRLHNRDEEITIKEKYGEDSTEYAEAKLKYDEELINFEARKGKMTNDEILELEIPKNLKTSDPKFFGKKIEWANDITKLMYTAFSKGTSKYKAMEYLDKNFNIPYEKGEEIFDRMKMIVKSEEEPTLNIFDIEPDIAQYSRRKNKFKEFEAPEKEITMTKGEYYDSIGKKSVEVQDVAKMDKSIVDQIPYIGDWFKSSIHTGYQSDSSTIRKLTARIAPATVSLKDSLGKLLPIKSTGMDYKRRMMREVHGLQRDMMEAFEEAIQNGYKGNLEKFSKETYSKYVEKVSDFENEAYRYAYDKIENGGSKKNIKEYLNEFYDNNELKLDEGYFGKSEKAHMDYFKRMLKEGKELGIKELKDVNINKPYIPRMYDIEKVRRGIIKPTEVKNILRESITSHYGNKGLSKEDLDSIVDDLHDHILNRAMDMEFEVGSYLVSSGRKVPSHLHGRKILLNDSKMKGLLVNNFEDIIGLYHYRMSGRFAAQKAFGTDNIKEIMDIVKQEAIEKGELLNEKDLKAFGNSVKDLLGDLRINDKSNTAAWTFTRNLLTYNSTRMGGNFGGNQVIEMAMAATWVGINNIMTGRIGRSFKSNASLLYGKGKDVDQFSEAMLYSGYLSNSLYISRVNRFSDTELGFNSGKLEHNLNKINDFLMKYNGLRYFVSVMEDWIGGSVVQRIMSGKVTPEMKARWGLTEREFRSLQEDMKKHVDLKNGKFELEKFSEENRDLFQLAISRGIDEMVIQGDSIHLPDWMKIPTPATKIIFQFMRFPMLAQEILLRRGMKEEQAKMVSATLSSMVTYMMLKYLREEASVQLGFKDGFDRKYDFFNDPDHLKRSLMESLNYTAPLGFLTALYNYGAVAMGEPELGREWTSGSRIDLLGASASLPEDLSKILKAIVNGEITDEKTLQKVKSLLPGANIGVLSEGLKKLNEEIGD